MAVLKRMAGVRTVEKMTRAEKSAQTRQMIIDTGFRLLKEKGYEKLTVRNVCEAAEVSTGSFYHFYKTKDDLMTEFLVQEEWYDQMENPEDIVEYIIFGYMKLITSYETLGIEFTTNYYTPANQAFNVYTRMPGKYTSDFLRLHLIEARENGFIRDDKPVDKIIYDIQAIFIGNVFQWCVVRGAIDLRMELERMLRDYLMLRVVTDEYRQKFGDKAA